MVKREHHHGTRPGSRHLIRRVLSVVFALTVCLGAAAVVYAAHLPVPPHRPVDTRGLRVSPRRQAAQAGSNVAYRIDSAKSRFRLRAVFPARAKALLHGRFSPTRHRGSGRSEALTVRIARWAPKGVYRVRIIGERRVDGRRIRRTGTATIMVTGSAELAGPQSVTAPPSTPVVSFGSAETGTPDAVVIAGRASGVLRPGTSSSLDLDLTDNVDSDLRVLSLVVTVASIDAPRATAALPCEGADFSVSQLSGAYGFAIPARSTRTLSQLGFSDDQLPRLAMVDRSSDQDGCQGATVHLRFAGSATGEGS